jgi:salicylate hydroxylase
MKLSVMTSASEAQVEFHKSSGAQDYLTRPIYHAETSRHWKTNQVVSVDTHTNVPESHHQTTRFHRGHVHAALLAHVPKASINLNKRIASAESSVNGVTLHFEDGSSAQGDLLIAADGLRSVRRIPKTVYLLFSN